MRVDVIDVGGDAPVAVIIPTVNVRTAMLTQAVTSARNQTVPPRQIVVAHDVDRVGPSVARNVAAGHTTGVDWLAWLDDDDVWMAHHLETLLAHADAAEVVYSLGRIVGRPGWDPQRVPFDEARMRRGPNFLPMTGITDRASFAAVGGFPTLTRYDYEDWHLWLRLLDHGARFVGVDRHTWTYRFGRWPSRSRRTL